MPVIILLLSLMAITAYSVLSIAGTSIDQSFSNGYKSTTDSAAKSGINYAKIQINDSYCGNYQGTEETNIVNNDNYRLSFKVEVTSASNDGLSKTVKSSSYLYLPANASRPKFTKSETKTIYSASNDKCKNPNFYSPLVWLDASDSSTLLKPGASLKTLSSSTSYGNAGDTTRDTLEERQDNGATSPDSFKNTSLDLHTCSSASFDNYICNNKTTKHVNVGLIFQNINIPKNASIASATLELKCSNNQSSEGLLSHRIKGFYQSSSDYNPSLFNGTAASQLKNVLDSNELHTNSSTELSENSCNPNGKLVFNVKDIVQEIVNGGGWNPTEENKASLGLAISYLSGFGSRSIYKSGNTLTISYSTNPLSTANNGETVGAWVDKSGNSNNGELVYGNAPTFGSSTLNNKPSLEFNNSVLGVKLSRHLDNAKEMTVFAVIKPNFGSSSTSGRIISGIKDSAENDDTNARSIIPLFRNTDKNGFATQYAAGSAFSLTNECQDCSGASILTSLFAKAKNQSIRASLAINNQVVASNSSLKPVGSPYTYSIDRLYIGGSRTGLLPGNGASYFNGNYSELIVYDKALSCRQINSVNNYLREKWNISNTVYPEGCVEDITVF